VCVKPFQKARSSFYGSEQSFSFTAGPGIVDKSLVVDIFQIIVDQSVHDTISDLSDRNFAALIIIHNKFSIAAVIVFTGIEILKKIIKVFLKIILKMMQFISGLFAFSKFLPASPNIF